MKRYKKQKAKMISNTLILTEETKLRVKLAKKEEYDYLFRLQMLICFRPDASLRQINNQCKINF